MRNLVRKKNSVLEELERHVQNDKLKNLNNKAAGRNIINTEQIQNSASRHQARKPTPQQQKN